MARSISLILMVKAFDTSFPDLADAACQISKSHPDACREVQLRHRVTVIDFVFPVQQVVGGEVNIQVLQDMYIHPGIDQCITFGDFRGYGSVEVPDVLCR